MPRPYVFARRPDRQSQHDPQRKIIVTGAAGRIGSYFCEHYHDRYRLRMMVHPQADDKDVSLLDGFGEVVRCGLEDLDRLTEVCAGMHTMVHLAADANPNADWDSLLPNNIIGTYHAMTAAQRAGCKRLIYASSIHAVSGSEPEEQVKTNEPVAPGDLYGVSKCFSEALARLMATKHGLAAIAIRIGAFQSVESVRQSEQTQSVTSFVSDRDLAQLISKAIDADHIQFAIVHGLSDNAWNRMDISDTRDLLGYEPLDDFARANERLRALDLRPSE